jgi:hypothetical protein
LNVGIREGEIAEDGRRQHTEIKTALSSNGAEISDEVYKNLSICANSFHFSAILEHEW